jgi:hypothetical protein
MFAIVLLGSITGFLLSQQTGWTRSFGSPMADTLLAATPGGGEDTVLLTVPGSEEARLAGQVATSGVPAAEKESMRKALTRTRAYTVDSRGQVKAADAVPQVVKFEDPATGEEMQLELLAVQAGNRTRYVVRPDMPPLLGNPVKSNLSLLERNAALFVLDTGNMSVRLLGDSAERSSLIHGAVGDKAGEPPVAALNWGQEAHWSPDGRYIAFLSNRDILGEQLGNSVWVHEYATGRELAAVHGQAGQHVVVRGWTPANELIADEYTRANGNSAQTLVALKLDGSRRRLVSAPGSFVAQTPDGRTLIWLQRRGGRPNELRALDLSGGRQGLIWKDTPAGLHLRSLKVAFSADGQRLVTDLEDSRNAQKLLVYNLKTGQTRILPVSSGWQLGLPVSWAANRLVLPLERKGVARTFLVNPDEQ